MKKKLFIIGILALFLTACNVDYKLELNDDTFKEKVEITNKVSNVTGIFQLKDLEKSPEYLNSFYHRNYRKDKTLEYLDLEHVYQERPLEDSLILKECFDNFNIIEKEDLYYITAGGKPENITCNFLENVRVSFSTKNKVVDHNADSVNEEEGLYRWNGIDKGIKIVVAKNEEVGKTKIINKAFYIRLALLILALLFLVGVILYRRNNK